MLQLFSSALDSSLGDCSVSSVFPPSVYLYVYKVRRFLVRILSKHNLLTPLKHFRE